MVLGYLIGISLMNVNIICGGEYFITKCATSPVHFIYFKNKEDAQKVIDNPNFRITLDILYR